MSKKKKKSKLPFKFIRRSRFEKLEREVVALKEARDALPLYHKIDGDASEEEIKIPLTRGSLRTLLDLGPPNISDQVHVASDILGNEDEVNAFVLWLETSEGVFVRMIERDADKVLEVNDERFKLKLTWAPIHAGKALAILDGIIVHRGRPLRRVDYIVGTAMVAGDTLHIDYTFKG